MIITKGLLKFIQGLLKLIHRLEGRSRLIEAYPKSIQAYSKLIRSLFKARNSDKDGSSESENWKDFRKMSMHMLSLVLLLVHTEKQTTTHINVKF